MGAPTVRIYCISKNMGFYSTSLQCAICRGFSGSLMLITLTGSGRSSPTAVLHTPSSHAGLLAYGLFVASDPLLNRGLDHGLNRDLDLCLDRCFALSQWRDRTGLSPVSLLASHGEEHEMCFTLIFLLTTLYVLSLPTSCCYIFAPFGFPGLSRKVNLFRMAARRKIYVKLYVHSFFFFQIYVIFWINLPKILTCAAVPC